jgi:hypothetical protein
VDQHWASSTSMYGISPQAPSYGVAAPTQHMGSDDISSGWRALVDPHNPLFWLGVIGATTLGLGAFASNVRVGRSVFKVSVGDTKDD